MPTIYKLHPARDAQLAALAAAQGTTKSAALDFCINNAIFSGFLPDLLPGFEAWSEGPAVAVVIEGAELPLMSPAAARSLAEVLTALANGTSSKEGYKLSPRSGGRLDVVRMGAGIKAVTYDAAGEPAKTSTMTLTMVGDFCRALSRAADDATIDDDAA